MTISVRLLKCCLLVSLLVALQPPVPPSTVIDEAYDRLQAADRCNLLCAPVRTVTIVRLPSALAYLVMAIVVLVLLGLKRPMQTCVYQIMKIPWHHTSRYLLLKMVQYWEQKVSVLRDCDRQNIKHQAKPHCTSCSGTRTYFVHSPLGSIVTVLWNEHLSLKDLQSHLTSSLGIPKQYQQLLYCNKPLTCDGFQKLPNNSNIQLIIQGKGGSGECDICFVQGTLICNDCQGKFFCSDCCRIFHKHPSRKNHQPVPVSDDRPQQIDQPLDEESDSFDITDSPSINDTFQEASKVCVLAETFDLTRFHKYQKMVIDSTLEGKDTLIIQGTGSGKSLCYQFPPVFEGKKAIVVSPTISLMEDQVENLQRKGIPAIFLGSAQLDTSAESRAFEVDSDFVLIYVTPEWLSKPEKKSMVRTLNSAKKLSLIAIDEGHLYYEWQEFRPAYRDLANLKYEFPRTPIMILTATATPETTKELLTLLRDPVIARGSVNRRNIYLAVEEVPTGDFQAVADKVSEVYNNESTIVYTDFIDNVGKIISSLQDLGIEAVGYYGEMSAKHRSESYRKWKSGEILVMVATKAFGLGIDKENIRNVLRHGAPESITQWVQEFGRAGRDGNPANAILLYSPTDTSHAHAWIKDHLRNPSACQRILSEFSMAWRYVLSHKGGICRRKMILELFDESTTEVETGGDCCDVCRTPKTPEPKMQDCTEELKVLVSAIDEIGSKGEVKLVQWIRGSHLAWTEKFNTKSNSYGNSKGHTDHWWRQFVCLCHVYELVQRQLQSIINRTGSYSIEGLYKVSHKGRLYIEEGKHLLVPLVEHPICCSSQSVRERKNGAGGSNLSAEKRTKHGKGTHGILGVKKLMNDQENWRSVTSKYDHQFPGIFDGEVNQQMIYIPDCSKLPQYTPSDPHFLWKDIQFSKGKLNKPREVKFTIGGQEEALIYRSAPCRGIKYCPEDGCGFVASLAAIKCPGHESKRLCYSTADKGECPVEFCYIHPTDIATDHRRWIAGFVLTQKESSSNLHNHLRPSSSKISSFVKEKIASTVKLNPLIKPKDIQQGSGIGLIPAAVDQASANTGRLQHEVHKAREQFLVSSTKWKVNSFEDVANEIDEEDENVCGAPAEEVDQLKKLSRPYLASAGIENGINYIHTMSPYMTQVLANTDFVEADVTFNETKEYPYLFNMTGFDEVSMEWVVVSRVRMDKQTWEASALAFKKTFEKASKDCPKFSLGGTLMGIVIDWSDAEVKGLKAAIGDELASELLRGCLVHWGRSWVRIRKRVVSSDPFHKAVESKVFSKIAASIPKQAKQSDVVKCFEALCSNRKIKDICGLVQGITQEDAKLVDKHACWDMAKAWSLWWTRQQHLKMLSPAFTTMPQDIWKNCPSNTNAVERKNADSKEKHPVALNIAMITLYKQDKSICAKHVAAMNGMKLSYKGKSKEAKAQQAEVRQKQRLQKSSTKDKECMLAPPDKEIHFAGIKRKSANSSTSHAKKRAQPNFSDSDDDFTDTPSHHSQEVTSYVGRSIKMKFFMEDTGKLQWFKGKITHYNPSEHKCTAHFPYDNYDLEFSVDDEDVRFLD